MRIFWKLLGGSGLVQSAIALIIVGTVSYGVISQAPVPNEYWTLAGLVVGFFFGAKVQQAAQSKAASYPEKEG